VPVLPAHKVTFERGEVFPDFKVLRQCPFFLLIKLRLREGKALGSEEGKGLGSGLCCEQRKENEERLCRFMFGIFVLTLGVALEYQFYLNLGE
jgi:hypothetical protein